MFGECAHTVIQTKSPVKHLTNILALSSVMLAAYTFAATHITRCNATTKGAFFSDARGAGYEKKRKSMDNAWTITTGLTIIKPAGST